MKNILFPTDFSANADHALEVASAIASRSNANLILLHSLYEKDEEESANAQMKMLENKLKEKLSIKINCVIAEAALVTAIKTMEKRKNIDLIVMGTNGITSFKKAFAGSNTSRVIEAARSPVLVIPSEILVKSIVNIAYATDYTNPEIPVVNFMAEFAALFNANLIILHIIDRYETDAISNGRNYIGSIKNKINYQKIAYHLIHTNEIAEGIEEFVSSNKIDILATATHHRGVFETLMKGSLTHLLLNGMAFPLLVQHKKAYEKTEVTEE